MNLFLTLAFLFLIGSVLGWGLEVIFRRFFSAHRWVNPGFLVGPYLPLYGSSLCVLYLLAMLESLMPVENPLLKKIMLFVVMALAITALEYVAGLIFIRGIVGAISRALSARCSHFSGWCSVQCTIF